MNLHESFKIRSLNDGEEYIYNYYDMNWNLTRKIYSKYLDRNLFLYFGDYIIMNNMYIKLMGVKVIGEKYVF